MQYNTQRTTLFVKEYGRHVQALVEQLCNIPEKQERLKKAHEIVKVLKLSHPQYKTVENNDQKTWDILYYISNFKLDLDSPYPPPDKNNFQLKPATIPYKSSYRKRYQLGSYIRELISDTCNTDDENIKNYLIKLTAHYIRTAYRNWYNEQVSEQKIKENILKLSEGKLVYDNEKHFTPQLKAHKTPSSSYHNNYHRKERKKSGYHSSRN